MIMKKNRAVIWIVLLLVAVGGCAAPARNTPRMFGKIKGMELSQAYIQKGRAYENRGSLTEALRQYKLAMVVSPANKAALKDRNRVVQALRRLATTHYKVGLQFHKAGEYAKARRKFLTALRFNPDYPEALKMLKHQKVIKDNNYIVHKIQPGESLSKIAMIYYGDSRKFSVLARHNNITDATQVKVGREINIPKTGSAAFYEKKQPDKQVPKQETEEIKHEYVDVDVDIMTDVVEPLESDLPDKQVPKQETVEVKHEYIDVAAMCRDKGIDLFNKKKYPEAIFEFNKAVDENSNDEVAVEYLYKAHLKQGMGLFEKEDYLSAKEEFEASLRFNGDCLKCREYIKKSEDTYKEIHYKRGVAYFGKEQLFDAIGEWEIVQAIDPNYKNVAYNIDKARTLLKRLEEIRKSLEERQAQ